MAIGGPALGVGFGIIALIIIKFFTRGTMLFIHILIALSYTVFLVSEKFGAGVSGLLGLCGAGILMNIYGKDYMTNA